MERTTPRKCSVNTASTQVSSRKRSDETIPELACQPIPEVQEVLKLGFIALQDPRNRQDSLKSLLSRFDLNRVLEFIVSSSWRVEPRKSAKQVRDAVKAARMVSKLVKFINPENGQSGKILTKIVKILPDLILKDRHGVYMTLKILNSIIQAFPNFLKNGGSMDPKTPKNGPNSANTATRDILEPKFLKNLGRRVSLLFKVQQHKKRLRLAIKVLRGLNQPQRVLLATDMLILTRDFSKTLYQAEVKKIVNLAPKAFTIQSAELLANASTPEQYTLDHQARLLHLLAKDDPKRARKYYYGKGGGLRSFFVELFKIKIFDWKIVRFILVFIVDFEFGWRNLKFQPQFLQKVLNFVYENPWSLDLVEDRLAVFDHFLLRNEVLNHPSFASDMKIVTKSGPICEQIIRKLKKLKFAEKRKLRKMRKRADFVKIVQKALKKEALELPEVRNRLEVEIPVTSQPNIFGLLESVENQNTQLHSVIHSMKGSRDLSVLTNSRNLKILKYSVLQVMSRRRPHSAETATKKIVLTRSGFKKTAFISISLKRFAKSQNAQNEENEANQGNEDLQNDHNEPVIDLSYLHIHQLVPNSKKKYLCPTNLKFYQTRGQPRRRSSSIKELLLQSFDDDILGFEVIGPKIHFWGKFVFGVISLSLSVSRQPFAPTIYGKTKTVKNVEAKLTTYKRFSHCLIEYLLPLDDRFFVVVPRSEVKCLELFDIGSCCYQVLQTGEAERGDVKKAFDELEAAKRGVLGGG